MLVYPPTVGAPVLSLESETSVVILPVHENGMHRDFRTYSYIDFEAVPNIGLVSPWSKSGAALKLVEITLYLLKTLNLRLNLHS